MKEEDALKKVITFKKEGTGQAYQDWLSRCYEGFRFKVGDQWDGAEKQILKSQNRPYLVFNRVLAVLNLLSGSQRQNRQDFKVYARKGGNEASASIQTELLKHTMDVTNANWKLSGMFDDGNTGGKGWLALDLDYTYDPINGDILLERVSPFEMVEDPITKQYDLNEKARFVIRKFIWDRDELNLRYPKAKGKIKNLAPATAMKEGGAGLNIDEDDYNRDSDAGFFGRIQEQRQGVELFEVSECWWKTWERREMLVNTKTFEVSIIDEKKREVAQAIVDNSKEEWKIMERTIAILHKTSLVGNSLLEHVDDPLGGVSSFPFVRFCPYFIDGIVMGIVDNLVDPQREHNKRRSQALHHLNLSANSGWIADDDAVSDWSLLENFGSKPGIVIKKKAGSVLDRIDPARLSEGHLTLSEMSAADIREISGVNLDLQGLSASQQSGKAIELKQRQGMIMNEIIFDNFYYTLQILGNLLLDVFRKTEVYSEAEITAIAEKAEIPVGSDAVKSFRVGRYGTKVSLSAQSPTIRMSNHFALLEATKSGLPISPKFAIKNSEIPDKEEIIKEIEQSQQSAAQQAQQAQQLEMAKVQNDMEIERGKLQVSQEKNEIERYKIALEHQEKEMELAIKANTVTASGSKPVSVPTG